MKAFAAKRAFLSSVPGAYKVEEEKRQPQVVLSPLYPCWGIHNTYTQRNILLCKNKQQKQSKHSLIKFNHYLQIGFLG